MTRTTPGPRGPFVVGVDLGTGSAKAVALDAGGRAVAEAAVPVGLDTPEDGRAEQDPDALVAAATGAVRRVVAEMPDGVDVAGIALSAAMHSLLAVGDDGRPLTPALTYADNRAVPQVTQIAAQTDAAELCARTGTPLHPMSPLAKLRWFAQERPDVARAARRWISVKEYLLQRWCDAAVVDHSMAAATGLFDLERRNWDAEALKLAAVDATQLSRPVPTTMVLDGLDAGAARGLGVPRGTPVVVGASDGCLANLGAGAVGDGVAALTIGSSGAVRMVTDRACGDAGGRLFCYPLTAETWVVGGPISSGGLVLSWARERLLPELADAARAAGAEPYERFTELAGSVPPGAGGVLFLPHLLGERAPQWDPSLRGALLGLSARTGREHVLRALLEGVAFQLAAVVAAMEALGHDPRRFRASGGFTASTLWLQIVADVLGRDLDVPAGGEASCVGAALLGFEALGFGDALDLARTTVRIARTVHPDPRAVGVYRDLRPVYARLQEQLADGLRALHHHAGPPRRERLASP